MWPRKLPLDNVDFFPRRLIENRLYLFTINMLYDVRTLYYVRENHRVSNDRQQTAKTSITTTKTHTITQYRCVNVEKLIWIEVRICFGREGKLKIDPEAAKKNPKSEFKRVMSFCDKNVQCPLNRVACYSLIAIVSGRRPCTSIDDTSKSSMCSSLPITSFLYGP